jgi:hypothetical protein
MVNMPALGRVHEWEAETLPAFRFSNQADVYGPKMHSNLATPRRGDPNLGKGVLDDG